MGTASTRKKPEEVDADAVEAARRARKRVTDRKSQRHHRDRQRAYIKQLEETVRSYEGTCSQNGSADAAALLNEVEKLRSRCRELESILHRIKGLATGPDEEAAGGSRPSAQDDDPIIRQNERQATCSDVDAQPHYAQAEPLMVWDSWPINALQDFTASEEPVPAFHLAGDPVSGLSQELNDGEFPGGNVDLIRETSMACEPAEHDTTPYDMGQARPTGGAKEVVESPTSGDDLEGDLANVANGCLASRDLVLAQPLIRDDALTANPVDIWTLKGDMDETMHLQFPNTSPPACAWDRVLLNIIDDTRAQFRIGRYLSTKEPSLRTVLSDKSTDVLASRLYHHLCSYGRMPLHLLLSIFWVQYLYLRWHAVGTRSAYLQIPEFMRPTGLEMRIPHQPCIGMLVWPDVRRALIRDSHTADPSHIGTELLQHLSSSWSPNAEVTGDLIGSTDVLGIIEHQACQERTWKIDPSFQKKYPRFASCRFP